MGGYRNGTRNRASFYRIAGPSGSVCMIYCHNLIEGSRHRRLLLAVCCCRAPCTRCSLVWLKAGGIYTTRDKDTSLSASAYCTVCEDETAAAACVARRNRNQVHPRRGAGGFSRVLAFRGPALLRRASALLTLRGSPGWFPLRDHPTSL